MFVGIILNYIIYIKLVIHFKIMIYFVLFILAYMANMCFRVSIINAVKNEREISDYANLADVVWSVL